MALSDDLRAMLSAPRRRPTLDVRRPAAGPASVRGFDSLAERAPIPDDVRAYVAKQTGAAPAQPSSVDTELADAQDADARSAFFSRAGQGFDDAGRVIAGLPQSITRNAVDGDASVSALLQRRGGDARQQEVSRKAALSDPNSPESRRFRARIAKVLPGLLDEATLADVTAADEESLLKYGSLKAGREEREATRKAAEAARAAADADRDEARKQREQTHRENLADRQAARAESAADRAARIAAARGEKVADAETKRTQTLAERRVGGFDFDPENPPTADGAKQMASAVAARSKILGSLGRLEGLFSENGPEATGASASAMEAEWKNITDQVRILGEMGVPNGSDYDMLAKQIPQTTGWGAVLTPGNRASIAAKFPVLREQINRSVDATAEAYKYRPARGGASQRTAAPRSAPAGKVRVSNGSETLEIDAADLAAAEADGYQRVTQ